MIGSLLNVTITNHASGIVVNNWSFRIAAPPCPRAAFTGLTSFTVKCVIRFKLRALSVRFIRAAL